VTKPEFVTLASSLIGPAETVARYFEDLGYKVVREPDVVDYPYTPTLRCKRDRTTIIVEVDSAIRLERVREWVRYGRSRSFDFRVAIATSTENPRDVSAEDATRNARAGVYVVSEAVTEIYMHHDLSVNLDPPELAEMSHKMKKALGPMYEQFDHSHWREGLETGCQSLEAECRKYLKKGIASGRVVILNDAGRRRQIAESTIDKMTLGRLAVTFAHIQTPNHADTALASVLAQINPHRVAVAHHKTTPQTEAKLRKHVGKAVWLLVAGMRKLFGEA
jgi:hypothetical protein